MKKKLPLLLLIVPSFVFLCLGIIYFNKEGNSKITGESDVKNKAEEVKVSQEVVKHQFECLPLESDLQLRIPPEREIKSARSACEETSSSRVGIGKVAYSITCEAKNCFEGLSHYSALCDGDKLLSSQVEKISMSPDQKKIFFSANGNHYLYFGNTKKIFRLPIKKPLLVEYVNWSQVKNEEITLHYYDSGVTETFCIGAD